MEQLKSSNFVNIGDDLHFDKENEGKIQTI
jgi:hypothetical protein